MNLENLTDDDLTSWRASPVTEIMKACLWKIHDAQKAECLAAYWAGTPWPDADMQSLKRMSVVFEDIFEATSDDLKAVMERINDEPIGNNPN